MENEYQESTELYNLAKQIQEKYFTEETPHLLLSILSNGPKNPRSQAIERSP